MHKALDEGRLKFGDKSKQPIQVDVNPLKKADSMYVDIADVNMVEISEIEPVLATESPRVDVGMASEDLIDFLNRCKISSSRVMLCLRCSALFDK